MSWPVAHEAGRPQGEKGRPPRCNPEFFTRGVEARLPHLEQRCWLRAYVTSTLRP
jgi:hypothetical protein